MDDTIFYATVQSEPQPVDLGAGHSVAASRLQLAITEEDFCQSLKEWDIITEDTGKTRICAAEMAVRYAALSACRKVRVSL